MLRHRRNRGGLGGEDVSSFHFRDFAAPERRPQRRPCGARGGDPARAGRPADDDDLSRVRGQTPGKRNSGAEPVVAGPSCSGGGAGTPGGQARRRDGPFADALHCFDLGDYRVSLDRRPRGRRRAHRLAHLALRIPFHGALCRGGAWLQGGSRHSAGRRKGRSRKPAELPPAAPLDAIRVADHDAERGPR
jgi:hypothetical protein